MKILFFLSIGLDRQATSGHLLTAMVSALCKEGHTVHIIQKDTGGDLPPIPETLSDFPVTTDRVPFRAADKSNFIARYLSELNYIRASKKYFHSDYDAVFVQSTTAGGFAVRAVRTRLKHAIVTFNVQDVFPYNLECAGKLKRRGLVFKALAAVQRYAYRHSDHIITISEDMKDLLVEDGTPAEKIEVVYNWSYQDEPYDRDRMDLERVSQMFPHDKFHVVYAGNIGLLQNVDIMLEAAKLMKDDDTVRFHIIGNGVYKEKLQARAEAYGLDNVSFWPMQPSELAPLIYASADVNVIPLAKGVYRTALPSKTATCMACGKPIIFAIGTDSRFGRRVSAETGCPVIESGDAEEFVKAIAGIRDGAVEIKTQEFFSSHMQITKNSKNYKDIICSGKK